MYRVCFELGDCYFTKDFMCCEMARNLYNSVPEDCCREVRELIDGEWCVGEWCVGEWCVIEM